MDVITICRQRPIKYFIYFRPIQRCIWLVRRRPQWSDHSFWRLWSGIWCHLQCNRRDQIQSKRVLEGATKAFETCIGSATPYFFFKLCMINDLLVSLPINYYSTTIQVNYVNVGKDMYLIEVPESLGGSVPRNYELQSTKKVIKMFLPLVFKCK